MEETTVAAVPSPAASRVARPTFRPTKDDEKIRDQDLVAEKVRSLCSPRLDVVLLVTATRRHLWESGPADVKPDGTTTLNLQRPDFSQESDSVRFAAISRADTILRPSRPALETFLFVPK